MIGNNMEKLLKSIEVRYAELQTEIGSLREQFARVMRDKTIPLDTRWQAFVDAPIYLKNHERWIWRSLVIDFHKHFELQRYEVVKSVNIVDWCEDYEWYTPELAVELKEEILLENLGSFTNDW